MQGPDISQPAQKALPSAAGAGKQGQASQEGLGLYKRIPRFAEDFKCSKENFCPNGKIGR
jgi:hypothetical protein